MSVNKNIIFCDTNQYDGNINLHSLKKILKKKNIFVMLVPHMYGNPSSIREIKKLCSKKKIFLIEDCAQSLGTSYNKKPLGSFGDAAIFSFGYSKNIDVGQGGCVALNNQKIAKNIENLNNKLKTINIKEKNRLKKIYRNNYLDHIKNLNNVAFIKKKNFNLIKKLFINQNKVNWIKKVNLHIKRFEKTKKMRKKNYKFYENVFKNRFKYMKIRNNTNPWRFNLLVSTKIRDKVVNKMWNEGIHANIMYPSVSNFLYGKKINSKNAFKLEKRIINLPLDNNTMTNSYKKYFKSKIPQIINFRKEA